MAPGLHSESGDGKFSPYVLDWSFELLDADCMALGHTASLLWLLVVNNGR